MLNFLSAEQRVVAVVGGDQVTDPVSAQRELMRMGRLANVIVFSPSLGSPADFFAP